MSEPTFLLKQFCGAIFCPSHTTIGNSSPNVPDAYTLQTFRTERWGPKLPLATRTQVLTLRTSRPNSRPPPRVRPARSRTGAAPPDGAQARRRRPGAGRGARGAPRERPVSYRPQHGVGRHRRPRHLPAPQTARGPRGGSAGKFRFSAPGP